MNSNLLASISRLPFRNLSALARANDADFRRFFEFGDFEKIAKANVGFGLFEVNNRLKDLMRAGRLHHARQLFDEMPQRDEVSWTTIIGGYVNGVLSSEALVLFARMRSESCLRIDQFVVSLVLKACANLPEMEMGAGIHGYSLKTGLLNSVFVGSALVDLYMKGHCISKACQMFDEMPDKNAVTWTAVMTGLVQADHCDMAIIYFSEMLKSHVTVDSFVFSTALKACACLDGLSFGKEIHAQIIQLGFSSSSFVANALVAMYQKCGRLDDAFHLFKSMRTQDVVSWTTMIVGCVKEGYAARAVQMFVEMQNMNVVPNEFTFAAIISACSGLRGLELGKQLHAHLICLGYVNSMSVANALVTLYSNCGYISFASILFYQMNKRDVVSWTSMIAGYCQEGHVGEAFQVLSSMRMMGCKENEFTLSSLLSVAACMAMLEQGKQIHALCYISGLEWDPMITSSLINMYSKCGSMESAAGVFCERRTEEIVSWTAMIIGYAEHGYSEEAVNHFKQMLLLGLEPDHVTFIGVLIACSHAGLVDEGFYYFSSMSKVHHIEPQREHYGCMIDLLCRAGRLDEAENMIKSMPFKPDDVVLSTLLRACRVHGNVECGKRTADRILEFEPDCAGTHITLSNIYAAGEKWKDSAEIRKALKEKGVKKEPGWSWIMVKDSISTFVAGDMLHPESDEIHALLEFLSSRAAGEQVETNDSLTFL